MFFFNESSKYTSTFSKYKCIKKYVNIAFFQFVEFTCKAYLNSHWKFFQKKNMDVNSPVNKNKQFHILIYGYTVEVEKLVFCQCALNLKDEDLIVA